MLIDQCFSDPHYQNIWPVDFIFPFQLMIPYSSISLKNLWWKSTALPPRFGKCPHVTCVNWPGTLFWWVDSPMRWVKIKEIMVYYHQLFVCNLLFFRSSNTGSDQITPGMALVVTMWLEQMFRILELPIAMRPWWRNSTIFSRVWNTSYPVPIEDH